ncbi:hypothetical protein LUZ60_017009 [Juncus effusus]|nr:hypothetical protein LUZ60_017009 [Juncus effusus]
MAVLPLPLSYPKFLSNSFTPQISCKPLILSHHRSHRFNVSSAVLRASNSDDSPPPPSIYDAIKRKSVLFLHICTYSIFFLASASRACDVSPTETARASTATVAETDVIEESEDGELIEEFEKFKSKTYALTVPLRIVALQGSIPPSWIKDFIQVQGKRVKFQTENRTTIDSIFSELSSASEKGHVSPKSPMSADLVSIGDSWLNYAIIKGLIEPIKNAQDQDWFKILSPKWKVYLCRNNKGELDPNGQIWAAPYRFGTMVIAYKKSKFKKHNLRPIEDWEDLWRPELRGKISMINCPREIIGATLKYHNASYNTKDIESQVEGGKERVLQSLKLLQKQVRIFDSVHYVKSFTNGDVWVTVGWSADVIPAAKRQSDVAVIVPKSGSSFWTDLSVVPNTSKFNTNKLGGRIRSPSPLIHQWMNFCLQKSRDLPFREMVIPGSSPLFLEGFQDENEGFQEKNEGYRNDGKPKLETNLVDGIPPREILEKCEFLEPMSEKQLDDYNWLVSNVKKSHIGGVFENIRDFAFRRFKAT